MEEVALAIRQSSLLHESLQPPQCLLPLLGYAGEINDRELAERAEAGYLAGDLIGRSGVERSYEDALRGRDGAEYVVVNAMGQRVSTLREGPPKPPIPGTDLVLTVDLRIQQAMEEAMAKVGGGAAVAIDPRDGGILGMVSRQACSAWRLMAPLAPP